MTSDYKDKCFYFAGKSNLLSDEMIKFAVSFHGARLSTTNSRGVTHVVDCGGDKTGSDGKHVMEQYDFVQKLYFTAMQATTPQDEDDREECQSAEDNDGEPATNSRDFVKGARAIKEGKTFTMLFVDPDREDEAGGGVGIRALFSYARRKSYIVFHAVGLTEDSDGFPHQHYGLIALQNPLKVWRFEEYSDDEFFCATACATLNDEDIETVDSLDEDNDLRDIPCDPGLSKLLNSVDKRNHGFYYTEDSGAAYYMLDSRKKRLLKDGGWVEKGFDGRVYKVAESVLITARGWILDA